MVPRDDPLASGGRYGSAPGVQIGPGVGQSGHGLQLVEWFAAQDRVGIDQPLAQDLAVATHSRLQGTKKSDQPYGQFVGLAAGVEQEPACLHAQDGGFAQSQHCRQTFGG